MLDPCFLLEPCLLEPWPLDPWPLDPCPLPIRECELRVARNALWPQWDAYGLYRVWGAGDTFGDSFRQTGNGDAADWEAGFTFSVPIGRRADKARLDSAQLLLARERAELQQLEFSVQHRLATLLAQVGGTHAELAAAQSRAQEAALWLAGARARYVTPPPVGDGDIGCST